MSFSVISGGQIRTLKSNRIKHILLSFFFFDTRQFVSRVAHVSFVFVLSLSLNYTVAPVAGCSFAMQYRYDRGGK